MSKGTRGKIQGEADGASKEQAETNLLGTDPLAAHLRGMVRSFIEKLVEEELQDALQVHRYQRVADDENTRLGYRHGSRSRTLTTSVGTTTITVPRGRLFVDDAGEKTEEWQSQMLPRYSRRARAVDDAVMMAYLSGANSRRIRGALAPMLKDAPLSKSAVSRVVRELKAAFDRWRTCSLEDRRLAYLFLDGITVSVRSDRRVQRMPVLVAVGVMEDGEKELLGLMLAAKESTAAWQAMVEDLAARGLRPPVLCVIDGNAGLRRAIGTTWPKAEVQRCVVHKLRNLEAHCPKKALDDLRRDFHAITEAASEKAAHEAYKRFVRVWSRRSEGVVKSLEEAGDELLTHYRFPKSQWKCLRTTNMIERLQEEFRRRIKTQSSFPTESSVLYLFYGIYESGQIRMRRIDGWKDIPDVIARMTTGALKQAA